MNTRDPHDVRKSAIEDGYIAADEEREELHKCLLKALGWHTLQPNPLYCDRLAGFLGTDTTAMLGCPPLDANLIATAKQKLLTTDELRQRYTIRIVNAGIQAGAPRPHTWALTQATVTHEARAILGAIRK